MKRAMGSHDFCGMPRSLSRRHAGGLHVEGDLRQESRIARRGGTSWWDVL